MPIDSGLRRAAIELYDAYTHAPLPRREFLRRLSALAGSAAAASSLLALLENNYAHAASVSADDARLRNADVSFAQLDGHALRGYLSQPAGAGPWPGMVLIHENRGLNPHIRDVARRLALEGFRVLAPDYLSTLGGAPSDEDRARELFAAMAPALPRRISLAAMTALREHGAAKVGVMGFCWGGGQAGQLAAHAPDLHAAVAYYGPAPMWPPSGRLCSCIMPGWMRASTPWFRLLRRLCTLQARAISCIAMKASITPLTMTPIRRASMPRRRPWPGRAAWRSCAPIWRAERRLQRQRFPQNGHPILTGKVRRHHQIVPAVAAGLVVHRHLHMQMMPVMHAAQRQRLNAPIAAMRSQGDALMATKGAVNRANLHGANRHL